MIPTVILLGLVAGVAVGARSRLFPLLVVGLLAAVGWGLLVASEGAFVGGALLAVPNYAFGAAVGVGIRYLISSTTSLGHRPPVG